MNLLQNETVPFLDILTLQSFELEAFIEINIHFFQIAAFEIKTRDRSRIVSVCRAHWLITINLRALIGCLNSTSHQSIVHPHVRHSVAASHSVGVDLAPLLLPPHAGRVCAVVDDVHHPNGLLGSLPQLN